LVESIDIIHDALHCTEEFKITLRHTPNRVASPSAALSAGRWLLPSCLSRSSA